MQKDRTGHQVSGPEFYLHNFQETPSDNMEMEDTNIHDYQKLKKEFLVRAGISPEAQANILNH